MRITIAYAGWGEGEQQRREKSVTLTVLLVIALFSWWLVFMHGVAFGAGNSGLTPDEERMAGRIREIARSSGGDWTKLSEDEQRYLVFDVSFGDEKSARMLLAASSGKGMHSAKRSHRSIRASRQGLR